MAVSIMAVNIVSEDLFVRTIQSRGASSPNPEFHRFKTDFILRNDKFFVFMLTDKSEFGSKVSDEIETWIFIIFASRAKYISRRLILHFIHTAMRHFGRM